MSFFRKAKNDGNDGYAGYYDAPAVINYADVEFRLISADYVNFTPQPILPLEK